MILSKRNISRFISNIPGWMTTKKIVVIESDDWGSARFPNIETVEAFKQAGYDVDKCGFSRYDCLETNEDIEMLSHLLESTSNKFGKQVRLTLLCNTSNPDYEKIESTRFKEYHGLSVTESVISDKKRNQIVELLKDGNKLGFLDLQYHGKEHLYVNRWMRDLQAMDKETLFAFNYKVCGQSPIYMPNLRDGYRSAFDIDLIEDLQSHCERIVSGINEFKAIYGFLPSYFVAPNGPFNKVLEDTLLDEGVSIIGMQKNQKMPLGNGKYERRFHWLGKRLNSGQLVITRNVIFEPMSAVSGNIETVIGDIGIAFSLNKPAIISSHRANYVGGIDENNRERGLTKLEMLLERIMKKWPDAIFLTSSQLANVMRNKNTSDEFIV